MTTFEQAFILILAVWTVVTICNALVLHIIQEPVDKLKEYFKNFNDKRNRKVRIKRKYMGNYARFKALK